MNKIINYTKMGSEPTVTCIHQNKSLITQRKKSFYHQISRNHYNREMMRNN